MYILDIAKLFECFLWKNCGCEVFFFTLHLHYLTKLKIPMSFLSIRFLLIVIGLLCPHVGCWGQILYSSQDPTQPMQWGMEKSEEEFTLKDSVLFNNEKGPVLPNIIREPVIPKQNLNTKPTQERPEQGTLYETGMATYYSSKTHGRLMANGTRYDRNDYFCAHKTLPFGTRIRVVNKKNGKEVIVDVRDRGPFAKGRVIDLSNKAAEVLGMLSAGVVPVDLWVLEE